MRLSDLQNGQKAVIIKILGHGAFRKRVIEMGFVRGRRIEMVLDAPLKDPISYKILGYNVSLRRAEAALIEVELASDEITEEVAAPMIKVESSQRSVADTNRREITVALIGNPNCGKTSLYNCLSGATEHVGNYSGVTVDVKQTEFSYGEYTIRVVDLPGTYSLAAYSPEELYVRRYLRENCPDIILNVVDASNLQRNLYLTTELIDMDRSMVIALNMYDDLRRSGAQLDYDILGKMIGVPMVPVVARNAEGIDDLLDNIVQVFEGRSGSVRHIHVSHGHDIEQALRALIDVIKGDGKISPVVSPRYLAIKFLEGDKEVEKFLSTSPCFVHLSGMRNKYRADIEHLSGEDITASIASAKYGFIDGALAETYVDGDKDKHKSTSIIDGIVTNKFAGFPLFLLIMLFIFWATFFFGQYPMDWIEAGVEFLGKVAGMYLPDGILKDLICDGIIGGVGGVIVFLPNILILYFCISFMEDTGYMARAAFIMDKIMHRIGLHGKSFIPLIMGFGCNVPAIMATRSIESRSSRLITMLINPFISCSARLPLYVLLAGVFFNKYAPLVFLGLYFGGVAVAVISAKLLRKFVFRKDETPFVMELPPYRLPTLRATVRHTWSKGAQYLRKMGGIILVASIAVWALNYFPRSHQNVDAEVETSSIDLSHDSFLEAGGKIINPVMEPLGLNWRASVAVLAGVPAKEIVVSTLGVLYTDDAEAEHRALGERMTTIGPSGQPDFTPASALALMVFVLLYCPCFATIAAIVKESGSWRWGAFSVLYSTVVAWLLAFATFHVATWLM